MDADSPASMSARVPADDSLAVPAGPAARHVPPVPPVRVSAAPAGILADLLTLARPGQWPKNLLVVPIVLLVAPRWSIAGLAALLWATAAFTLASASTYVVNDIFDRAADSGHPVKRRRPVASGRIPVPAAWAYAAALAGACTLLLRPLPLAGIWPVAAYLVLSFSYSRALKHLPLVDVFVVAAGFLLRAGEGYLVTGTPLSSWLLICIMSLCLLFTLGKRRHELADTGTRHRRALSGYSLPLVDLLILLTSALAITAYLLFMQQDAPFGQYARGETLLCAPFAIFGVFRYLQVLIVDRGGQDPVRVLLRDPSLVTNSILLAIALAAGLLAAHYPALAQSVLHKVV